MNKIKNSIEVRLGCQGRLVIPASLRSCLELKEGDKLIAREEEGKLIFEKHNTIKKRLKKRFTKVDKQRRLATELIAERREVTSREVSE